MKVINLPFPLVLLSGAVILALASPGEGKDPKTGNAAKNEGKVLFDFSGENPAANWVTVNDNVMGGRSKGGFSIKDDQLLFKGSTNTNGGGFSSIRSKSMDLGLAGHGGVMIRFKGDGRTYKFGLRMAGSRATYRADFDTKAGGEEWQVARIPFSSFAPSWRGMKLSRDRYPLKREKIESIGVMIYDKKDGPFRLEVDWIKAYAGN